MEYLHKIFKLLSLIFLLSLGTNAKASSDIDYNDNAINQQILSLKNLQTQDANSPQIKNYLEKKLLKLQAISDFAQGCVANKEQILNDTKSIQSFSPSTLLDATQSFNQDSLNRINQQKASCILIASHTNSEINFILSQLKQLNISEKKQNIFQLLSNSSIWNLPLQFINISNLLNLNQTFKIDLSMLLSIFFVTLIMGGMFAFKCYNQAQISHKRKIKIIFFKLSIYLPIVLPLVSTFSYLFLLNNQQQNIPLIFNSLLLLIGLILIKFSFNLYLDITYKRIDKIWKLDIKNAFSVVLYGILLTYIGKLILITLLEKNDLVTLITQLCIVFINLFFIFAWYNLLNSILNPRFLPHKKYGKIYFFKSILTVVVLGVFFLRSLLALDGFFEDALDFNLKIIVSCLVIISLLNWSSLLKNFDEHLQSNKTFLGEKLHRILGHGENSKIKQLTLIRFSILILTYILMIHWLLQFLVVNETLKFIYDSLLYYGFYLGNIKIVPIHIIYAFILYALVILLGKGITTSITSQEIFMQNPNRRHTATKLMNYFFNLFAMISSVIILGFSFEQICILLGALTIGFSVALQSVIYDFISGLILIVTKQIHIEDYISIKFISTMVTTNGYVQKINLLYTQLVGDQGAIINVPNSQLLKNILANNSSAIRTKKSYLNFQITHRHDVKKTEIIMRSLITKNKNIIQSGHLKPILSFENQGFLLNQNIYMVSLKIHVRSASKKIMVLEELQQTIEQELEKNHIEFIKE